ncbi:MAG: DUF1501 domain-containing protein [Bacteroidota bacterium]
MCNHKQPQKTKRGIGLEHGKDHQRDHQTWSRRTFLRQAGLAGTASFLLGGTPLHAITSSPLAMALASAATEDRILVLIRLKGGNDGLNTIIPLFDYGTYQSARNDIAIPQNELFNLTDELAMPNTMQALNNMWQGGQMKVVNNVGYPDHNLSHFRSTDIWSAGIDADEMATSGWLGRVLETQFPDFLNNPPTIPPAIQMGSAGNLTYTDSDGFDMSLNVADPEQLYEIAQTGQLYDPLAVPECHYGDQLSYLRTVANNTFRYAEVVAQAFADSTNSIEYENNGLAEQLALVARLIRGGLGTRLYMVVHDGFDTHASQSNNHPNLVNQLATAVQHFHEDISNGGYGDKVLSMTFSEFGRRIEQNASGGTDHGAAAPLFLFGEGLNGNGTLGGLPDLQEVDNNGNLRYTTDFRQVYATVLEQWLCLDAGLVDQVMGESFERLNGLGLTCGPVSTWNPVADRVHGLTAYYQNGQLNVSYGLYEGQNVNITLYNMIGQPLQRVYSGYQYAGEQRHQFSLADIGWAAGVYVCTVEAGNQRYSQQIQLIRR